MKSCSMIKSTVQLSAALDSVTDGFTSVLCPGPTQLDRSAEALSQVASSFLSFVESNLKIAPELLLDPWALMAIGLAPNGSRRRKSFH